MMQRRKPLVPRLAGSKDLEFQSRMSRLLVKASLAVLDPALVVPDLAMVQSGLLSIRALRLAVLERRALLLSPRVRPLPLMRKKI
jgi:hypothetical protein